MAAPLETVVKQLTDSGIISPSKLEKFIPPQANPQTVEQLVAELVKHQQLTPFQAAQVKAGKARALILGEYILLDRIGAGGMGQVFKAVHRRMDRSVAIKMLPPAMTKDAAAIARFEREVRAAAKLRHPNIVAADDAGQAGSAHFLVMEYVDGKDLSAIVKKDGPLPVNKAVDYTLQAARGLEFAHGEGVIHRDIKPANLLLDKKGVVKILDMGLARVAGAAESGQMELTGSGMIMGTVDFMSPEQAIATKHADHRADIYSLGITLYYLLSARMPYSGDTAIEKLMAHQTQPIPNLQDVQTTVPKQLDAVFKKMVAKKMEDRFQSMGEVIEELEALGLAGSASSRRAEVASTATLSPEQKEKLAEAGKKNPLTGITEKVASEKTKGLLIKIIGGSFGTIIAPVLVFYLIRYLEKKDAPPIAEQAASAPLLPPGEGGRRPDEGAPRVDDPVALDRPHPSPLPKGEGARQKLAYLDPAFQQWVKATQALPADKQLEAVSKKLVELNPGFNGKMAGFGGGMPKFDDGAGTEIGLQSDDVTDISPLRALLKLAKLRLYGATQQNRLADLSPLAGLALKELRIGWSQITDLSPLKDMSLSVLECGQVFQLSDLSPLRNLKLTWLDISGTRVTDLSPLKGMPLTKLTCTGTKVFDFSPLYGMPLTELIVNNSNVTDAVLNDLVSLPQISSLSLDSANASDAGMQYLARCPKLNKLTLARASRISDAACESLAKLTLLETLILSDTNITDAGIKRLHDMKNLRVLDLKQSLVTETGLRSLAAALPRCKIISGDRDVAERFIGAGGKVTVRMRGEALANIRDVKQLPSDVFTLEEIDMEGVKSIPDMQVLVGLRKLVLNRTSCPGWVAGTRNLPKLESLLLSETTVNDSNFDAMRLTKFPKLTTLDLSGTEISDLAQKQLVDLKNLASLDLRRTKVTAPGVAALQKALPNCQIGWDGSSKIARPATQTLDLLALTDAGKDRVMPGNMGKGNVWEKRGGVLIYRSDGKSGKIVAPVAIRARSYEIDVTYKALDDGRFHVDLPLEGGQVVPLIFSEAGRGVMNERAPRWPAGKPRDGRITVHVEAAQAGQSDQVMVAFNGTPLMTWEGSLKSLSNSGDVHPSFPGEPMTSLFSSSATYEFTGWTLRVLDGKATVLRAAVPLGTATGDKSITTSATPAFQQWVKATQAQPAEKQIEAVSKKLMELNPGFDGKVTGLLGRTAPTIQNGVVTEIAFVSDNVVDISPVRGLAGLKSLQCSGSGHGQHRLADLSPLAGMPLSTLLFSGTQVSDLSPLHGMPLTYLRCSVTPVSDLSPLQGLPLVDLDCNATQVADLSPLKGMKLIQLSCNDTKVSNLAPLEGMPLQGLYCSSTAVSDLSPLHRCASLKNLNVKKTKVPPAEIAALQKTLPNCKIEWDGPEDAATSQSNKPWESPAFKKWIADTQALPAEKQLEAVSKKLTELNPGFDGKLTGARWGGWDRQPKTENHVVIECGFDGALVADISPVP